VTGTYLRYVALGDSQTEGMNDGDEVRGYRGWADRLAERLTAAQPRLQYANLAVRGRVTGEVRTEQLPTALSLRPDLVTVLAGLNDLLRPRFDAMAVAGHLESMFEALTGAGARVVAFTLPDPGLLVPAARGLTRRAQDFNARVREAAHRHGVTLVDLSVYPICTDQRLWSADRLHLNTLGHTRLAAAVAHALDLPDGEDLGTNPLDPQRKPSTWRRAGVELRWAVSFVGPWLLRRALGKSSGDGRTAKRPTLAPARRWPEPDPVL
jgi:lysophospholipase L1-like esterase